MLGTDELYAYVDKYDIQLDRHYDGILGRHTRKSWCVCVCVCVCVIFIIDGGGVRVLYILYLFCILSILCVCVHYIL